MNLFIKFITALTLIVFVPAASVQADTVLLRNGDKLIGDIQNENFAVRVSYGQIVVGRAFCRNIIMKNSQSTNGTLKTINNDLISGTILNQKILIVLADGSRQTVNINDLDSLFSDESGSSRQVSTTIFTMNDGDRFSGKLLNPKIEIRTEYMAADYQSTDVNRIIFAINDARDALLLTTGDLIHGKLLLDKVEIAPDSFARLSLDPSNFSSIQFNARKMLLKDYSSLADSEKDGDGDGVADDADNCSNTPWGDRVDENGCSTGNIVAQAVGQSGKKGLLPQDIDGDSVPDDSDQCLQTPLGAEVNKSGCWSTRDILFDFDSYLVKRQYYPALDKVLTVLQKNPTLKIEIQGSADSIGPAEYNKLLSEKRAQTVKKYLIGKGIEPERLSAVGKGATQKAASNETTAGRALNRRIDFIVKE
jgi:OOP family OmpA-OmpF porin